MVFLFFSLNTTNLSTDTTKLHGVNENSNREPEKAKEKRYDDQSSQGLNFLCPCLFVYVFGSRTRYDNLIAVLTIQDGTWSSVSTLTGPQNPLFNLYAEFLNEDEIVLIGGRENGCLKNLVFSNKFRNFTN